MDGKDSNSTNTISSPEGKEGKNNNPQSSPSLVRASLRRHVTQTTSNGAGINLSEGKEVKGGGGTGQSR